MDADTHTTMMSGRSLCCILSLICLSMFERNRTRRGSNQKTAKSEGRNVFSHGPLQEFFQLASSMQIAAIMIYSIHAIWCMQDVCFDTSVYNTVGLHESSSTASSFMCHKSSWRSITRNIEVWRPAVCYYSLWYNAIVGASIPITQLARASMLEKTPALPPMPYL